MELMAPHSTAWLGAASLERRPGAPQGPPLAGQRLEMAGSHVAGSWTAAWHGDSWNLSSFPDFLEFYWDFLLGCY